LLYLIWIFQKGNDCCGGFVVDQGECRTRFPELLTVALTLLTAAPRLKVVVSINDSLMTSDPTLLTLS
jgi:hypothetical protein